MCEVLAITKTFIHSHVTIIQEHMQGKQITFVYQLLEGHQGCIKIFRIVKDDLRLKCISAGLFQKVTPFINFWYDNFVKVVISLANDLEWEIFRSTVCDVNMMHFNISKSMTNSMWTILFLGVIAIILPYLKVNASVHFPLKNNWTF